MRKEIKSFNQCLLTSAHLQPLVDSQVLHWVYHMHVQARKFEAGLMGSATDLTTFTLIAECLLFAEQSDCSVLFKTSSQRPFLCPEFDTW